MPRLIEQAQADGSYVAVPTHPAQQIVDAPVGGLSGGDLVEQMATYLETCGSGLLVADRGPGTIAGEPSPKPPVAYFPLRPSLVSIFPKTDAPGSVGRYTYNLGAKTIDIAPQNADFSRFFNPENDWWGLSPISLLQTLIEVDANVEQYNKATLKNGGVPDLALITEQSVTRSNAKRVQREFEQRHMRAGKSGGVVVLDAGYDMKPLGIPPKDMQFPQVADFTQDRILAVFGVPPIFGMDMKEASVLANADAQIQLFFKFTLPLVGRVVAESITRSIQRDFKDMKLRMRFAFERADALRNTDKERESAEKNYTSGIITRNEARAVIGLEPVDGGDEFVQRPAAINPFDGTGAAGTSGKGRGTSRRRPRFTPEFKAFARVAYKRQHSAARLKLKGTMRPFFAAQRERTLANFRKLEPEIGPLLAIPVIAAAAPAGTQKSIAHDGLVSRIFSTLDEASKFRDEVGPVFLAGMVEAGNDKLHELAPSMRLALKESHVPFQDFYSRWGASRVVDIQEETRKAIQEAIQSGFDDGLGTHEMEARISASFHDLVNEGRGDETETDFPEYRLERIARTEAGTMLNVGSFEGVKELVAHGSNIVKSWLSAHDELVRDSHAEMDDATSDEPIPANQLFENGLMFPNDPSGPAEEVINCRCSLVEEVINDDSGEGA